MLGQHPALYGFPEVNLFVSETLGDLWERMGGARQIQLHGLLRLVAHLYAGEQTMASLEMAKRWVACRFDETTLAVYKELTAKIAPLGPVDKSPIYADSPAYLAHIAKAFPRARYLHLLRHPRSQGMSMMKIANGAMVLFSRSLDHDVQPPLLDPQFAWLRVQQNILDFLQSIPPARWRRIRGEDLLASPAEELRKLGEWLGLSQDEDAIERMLHPEDSPFACLGPCGAHLGNDINFLRSPVLRPHPLKPQTLRGPLPWRPDGGGFKTEVVELALTLGYESA